MMVANITAIVTSIRWLSLGIEIAGAAKVMMRTDQK